MPSTAAIIVAAGSGTRAGGGSEPKQYQLVGGKPMLAHSIAAFAAHPAISMIQVVIGKDQGEAYARAIPGIGAKLLPPVLGGADRQASVCAGLEALAAAAQPDAVLIHDAARPFLSPDIISRVLEGLTRWTGAIAAVPLTDTLKKEAASGAIEATIDRRSLWRAQTPQAFRFPDILAAHRAAAKITPGGPPFTDDASLAEAAGLTVGLVLGAEDNRKITTPEDFPAASRLGGWPDFRSGTGFDVHRFAPGDCVWLCGVRVPYTQGVDAHSDGDVALHALTDALLGAIGAGDIGQHFPPSDPRWKGEPSATFLAEAARLVRAEGGRIANVDVTILCEQPRIGPHREAMRQRMAEILGLKPERVSVKATTTEKLGFTGRGEGLAAMASAMVLLPGAI